MPPPSLPPAVARRARLHSMLLPAVAHRTAQEVVAWHGALQSQDYASGLWSMGARISGSTVADMQAALENGDVARTWPMRGTIHTVPSTDVRWMLELTGTRALDSSTRRREQLGLSLPDAERGADVLTEALSVRTHLTRKEALATLNAAGIDTTGQRGYHLLWYSAQTGRTCIGPTVEGEQTFVLLDSWAPEQVALSRSDALTELVHRYFRSHGPATERDFAGWTGLTLADTRAGLAANTGRLAHVSCAGVEQWWSLEAAEAAADGAFDRRSPAVVLPGFDEFVLGYKDRSLHLAAEHFDRVVPGGNGVFRATIIVDGSVVGTWVRRLLKEVVAIDIELFMPQTASTRKGIDRAFLAYADYLGLGLRLTGLDHSGE